MMDALATQAVAQGDDDILRELLFEVCEATRMGFAAIARVTEDRWIACQVEDRIQFGLTPGDELEIKQTICNLIRQSGSAIIIDEVGSDPHWRTHPVPLQFGFQSYVSFPIIFADGSFYGTLCAIDPEPRALSAPEMVLVISRYAALAAHILARRIAVQAG